MLVIKPIPAAFVLAFAGMASTTASAELASPTPKGIQGGAGNWPQEVPFPADSRWELKARINNPSPPPAVVETPPAAKPPATPSVSTPPANPPPSSGTGGKAQASGEHSGATSTAAKPKRWTEYFPNQMLMQGRTNRDRFAIKIDSLGDVHVCYFKQSISPTVDAWRHIFENCTPGTRSGTGYIHLEDLGLEIWYRGDDSNKKINWEDGWIEIKGLPSHKAVRSNIRFKVSGIRPEFTPDDPAKPVGWGLTGSPMRYGFYSPETGPVAIEAVVGSELEYWVKAGAYFYDAGVRKDCSFPRDKGYSVCRISDSYGYFIPAL